MSNASKRTRVLVGLVSLTLLIGALLLAFQGSSILNRGQSVQAEFVSVLNVVPQSSEVRVAGIAVGRATSVETENGIGVVSMSVDSNIELKADASARLRVKSFLGEKYIDLDPGTADARLEGRIELSHTMTSADLGELVGVAGRSLDIPPDEITATLKLGNDTLDNYGEDLSVGIAGARRALDSLAAGHAEMFAFAQRADALLATLVAQGGTIGQIAANAESMITQAQDFVTGNRPVIESLLDDLTTLQTSLELRSGDLRRALEEAPTLLRLTRKLVNQITNNLLCAGNPAPVGIDGLGPYAQTDHRPPEKTPGELGSCAP